MKILVITSIFRPFRKGGTEVVAEMIIDRLAQEHAVTVVTLDRRPSFFSLRPSVVQEGNIRVIRIAPWNIFSYLDIDRYPFWIRALWHGIDCIQVHGLMLLLGIFARENPDIVCTHALKGIGYLAPLAIRVRGIPHIHTMHDIQFTYPNGLLLVGEEKAVLRSSLFLRWYQKYTRFIFGSPALVLFPSRFLREWYISRGFFGQSRVEVIPNPVQMSASVLSERPSEKSLHTPLRLLCIGQLEPHKGVRFLVEALESTSISCEVWFAGSGSLLPWLEEKARVLPWIKVLGVVRGEEKARVLREADYTVLPSLCYENSPTVINESFDAGTPLIAARIGGVCELIFEGENGYTFEAGDSSSFVAALEKAYTNKHYPAMSERAVRDSRQYSLESYMRTLSSFFSFLCQKK